MHSLKTCYFALLYQIYSDAADVIQGLNNSSKLEFILPNVHDGLHIMKFINASVQSSSKNSAWIDLNSI